MQLIRKISLLRSFECNILTGYIVITSRNVALSYMRHNKVRNKHLYYGMEDDLAAGLHDSDTSTEEVLVQQENVQELAEAIGKLPEQQRDIIYMKYIINLSDGEIAQQLGISPDSVRVYLHRARRQARAVLQKERNEDV